MKKQTSYDLAILKKLVKPKTRIYTQLQHVSASGMTRRISIHVVNKGEIFRLDYHVSKLLGLRLHKDGGIVMQGCGMDMGFALAYDLWVTLFPKKRYQGNLNHSWI